MPRTRTRTAAPVADAWTSYRRDLDRVNQLDADAQRALAERYAATGDERIAAQLVASNARLVLSIARKHARGDIPLLDLVQEGNLGLLTAVRRYDARRGVKLSSYAVWWIRAFVLLYVLRNWRLVRLGTSHTERRLFFNLSKTAHLLESGGRAATVEELAAHLKVSPARVADMQQRLAGPEQSLDATFGDEEGDRAISRMSSLTAPEEDRPDALAEREQLRQAVRRHLAVFARSLDARDRVLLRERWLREEPRSLQQLGERFGITRERARQLECRLLDRLRKQLPVELRSEVC